MKSKKKVAMPFGKNSHVRIVKEIALGLYNAGFLKRYVELGIRRGPAFNVVAPLVSGEAYGVDINKGCYQYIKHNKNLVWFHGKTEDFLKNHDKRKLFDLGFIDADHSHEASLNDFLLLFPLMREGGIILMHDTYPPGEKFLSKSYCNDTYKTAEVLKGESLKKMYKYEIVTLPFYFGISIIRKGDKQLYWEKG